MAGVECDAALRAVGLELACRFHEDGRGAAELRIREQAMGVTLDARRALRIRYVEPRPHLAVVPTPTDDDFWGL